MLISAVGLGRGISAGLVLVAIATSAACLERNTDFDEPASSSDTGNADASTTDASTSASPTTESAASDESTTDAACVPDGFEMDGDPSVQATLGELELVLETIDAIDRYNLYRDAAVPKTMYAAADADVRVCMYIACEDSLEYADITCVVGLAASEPESATPGCCGGNTVDLSYVCGGNTTAKAEIWVDMPPADCTPYTLTLAESAS
jgi:hypothetical protein